MNPLDDLKVPDFAPSNLEGFINAMVGEEEDENDLGPIAFFSELLYPDALERANTSCLVLNRRFGAFFEFSVSQEELEVEEESYPHPFAVVNVAMREKPLEDHINFHRDSDLMGTYEPDGLGSLTQLITANMLEMLL